MLVRMAQETMVLPGWQLLDSNDSAGRGVPKHVLLLVCR